MSYTFPSRFFSPSLSVFFLHLLGIVLVASCFICFAVISPDTAFSLFSCYIFVSTLSKPHLLSVTLIFVVSFFLDAYSSQLIGLSFYQFFLVYMCALRFRIILLNSRIIFGIYFFFLVSLLQEFVCFFITVICSQNPFDFATHTERVCVSVSFCCVYCLVAFLRRRVIS